jgi:hypothetical protein
MFKDSQEGQTHYYNDGCGCPEHNNMPDPTQTKDQTKDWEERFNQTILAKGAGWCFECCDYELILEDTKQFISTLLAEKDKEIEELKSKLNNR